MKDNSEIIKYLSECSGAELTTILASALSGRPESVLVEEGYETKLIFAEASRELDDGTWSDWELSAISEANPQMYSEDWKYSNGEPFLQMGVCIKCKIPLRSHAKNVVCPICSNIENLT